MRKVHLKLKLGLAMAKDQSTGTKLFHQQIKYKFKEETREVLQLEHRLYGAENWTLQKADQKYLERVKMWCWRRIKISWTDCVRNEEVLHRVKEERNILHTMKKGRLIGLVTSCVGSLLKHIIEGKIEGGIEVTRRRETRRKLLQRDLQETKEYWKLNEEALNRSVWGTCFGIGYGFDVIQTTLYDITFDLKSLVTSRL